MATTQAEFQLTAIELKDEFADFFKPLVFSLPGVTNPITGAVTAGATETIDALREDYDSAQIDGQIIRSTDFKLLVLASDVDSINLRAAGLRVAVDGKSCQVISVALDAANAVYTLQVRNG